MNKVGQIDYVACRKMSDYFDDQFYNSYYVPKRETLQDSVFKFEYNALPK